MNLIIRAGRVFVIAAAVAVIAALMLLPSGAAPQTLANVKLSGDVLTDGEVSSFTLSSDGRYVVYF